MIRSPQRRQDGDADGKKRYRAPVAVNRCAEAHCDNRQTAEQQSHAVFERVRTQERRDCEQDRRGHAMHGASRRQHDREAVEGGQPARARGMRQVMVRHGAELSASSMHSQHGRNSSADTTGWPSGRSGCRSETGPRFPDCRSKLLTAVADATHVNFDVASGQRARDTPTG